MELVKELKAFGTKVSTKLFPGDHQDEDLEDI